MTKDRAALVARVEWYYDRRQSAGFPEPFSEALRDLLADHARLVQERDALQGWKAQD